MTDQIPNWARHFRYAESLRQRADIERDAALARRCPEFDSGDAQCTADAFPEHKHRYRPEDLPSTPDV